MRLSPSMFSGRCDVLRLAAELDGAEARRLLDAEQAGEAVAEDLPCLMTQATADTVNRYALDRLIVTTSVLFEQPLAAEGRDLVLRVTTLRGRQHLILWRGARPVDAGGDLYRVDGEEIRE